jgi:hypothetical protein
MELKMEHICKFYLRLLFMFQNFLPIIQMFCSTQIALRLF